MLAILLLLSSAQGLKVKKQCPEMPTDYKTWDNKDAHWFGLIIDGKDAVQGPHVYDWDHKFFPRVWSAMQWVYQEEKTAGPPTMDTIMKIHDNCCIDWNFRENTLHPSGRDIHPMCSNMMSCEERVAMLAGMWDELYTHSGDSSCPKDISIVQRNPEVSKKQLLEKLLVEYNQAIADSKDDEDKLIAVANMSKTFMWIHPMGSGNGRLHSVLVQREVRRLGLGCGLFMFNQNKDAFVDTVLDMRDKLKEGLAMYEKSVASGKNAWLEKVHVDEHFARHKLPESLKKCSEKKTFGSGGNIQ